MMKNEAYLKFLSLGMVVAGLNPGEDYESFLEEVDPCDTEITGPAQTAEPTSTTENNAIVKKRRTTMENQKVIVEHQDGLITEQEILAQEEPKDIPTEESKDTTDVNEGDLFLNCKRCNAPFTIPISEQRWLKERGLELFVHCKGCRALRRKEKEEAKQKLAGAKAIDAAVEQIRAGTETLIAQTRTSTFQQYMAGQLNDQTKSMAEQRLKENQAKEVMEGRT